MADDNSETTFESASQARSSGYSDGYMQRPATHPDDEAYMDGHWDGMADYEYEHRD